jgi:hypothetical protein
MTDSLDGKDQLIRSLIGTGKALEENKNALHDMISKSAINLRKALAITGKSNRVFRENALLIILETLETGRLDCKVDPVQWPGGE